MSKKEDKRCAIQSIDRSRKPLSVPWVRD